MALGFLDENKIEGLKYLSALKAMMYREGSIVEKGQEKWQNYQRTRRTKEVLQALINKIPDKDSLIYNIKCLCFGHCIEIEKTFID